MARIPRMARAMILAGIAGCGGDAQTPSSATPDAGGGSPTAMPSEGAPPQIARLPIDPATAFDLNPHVDSRLRAQGPVIAAGDIPEGHGGRAESSLLLQFLHRDAEVRSGISGTVVTVRDQPETCDTEIIIIPEGNDLARPSWVVGYDHIKNVTLARGDKVAVGDRLGTPGSLFYGCDGPGRVELQINNQASGLAHCPLAFMPAATRSESQAAIRTLMMDWNSAVAMSIYDEADLAGAGCLTETSQP